MCIAALISGGGGLHHDGLRLAASSRRPFNFTAAPPPLFRTSISQLILEWVDYRVAMLVE